MSEKVFLFVKMVKILVAVLLHLSCLDYYRLVRLGMQTPKIINFPFVSNGKSVIYGFPKYRNITCSITNNVKFPIAFDHNVALNL